IHFYNAVNNESKESVRFFIPREGKNCFTQIKTTIMFLYHLWIRFLCFLIWIITLVFTAHGLQDYQAICELGFTIGVDIVGVKLFLYDIFLGIEDIGSSSKTTDKAAIPGKNGNTMFLSKRWLWKMKKQKRKFEWILAPPNGTSGGLLFLYNKNIIWSLVNVYGLDFLPIWQLVVLDIRKSLLLWKGGISSDSGTSYARKIGLALGKKHKCITRENIVKLKRELKIII
ncbi:hypothetical protein ACJX0J_028675, partial [Zea mays]